MRPFVACRYSSRKDRCDTVLFLRNKATRRAAFLWNYYLTLLLKQTVKSRAGVIRIAGSRRCWQNIARRSGSCARRHGVSGDRDACAEQLARVDLILESNAGRYRFQTLKARRRIKVNTLFAAVQDSIALGAIANFEIHIRGKGSRAVETARSRYRLH